MPRDLDDSRRIRMSPDISRMASAMSIPSADVDYAVMMGREVERMSLSTDGGRGSRIAVLDSGVPKHPGVTVHDWTSFVRNYSEDKFGHSTFVGSEIAGRKVDGSGVSGIAPNATVFYAVVLDKDGIGTVDDIVSGIMTAVDSWKVDVINMSLGIPRRWKCPESLKKACDYARKMGVSVFAAAGNDNSKVNWPAALDSTVCVGAVNGSLSDISSVTKADFSSEGPEVDFVAPGVNLTGAAPGGGYSVMSGTSMACPLVSGIACLIAAAERRKGASVSPADVKSVLRSMSVDLGVSGKDDETGFGIPMLGSSMLDLGSCSSQSGESTESSPQENDKHVEKKKGFWYTVFDWFRSIMR